MNKNRFFYFIVAALVLFGCATVSDKDDAESISRQEDPVLPEQRTSEPNEGASESPPPAEPAPPAKAEPKIAVPETKNEEAEVFDPSTISRDQYEEEKTEIQSLVEELNKITTQKLYNRWLPYCSDEYIAYYSNPEVLKVQTSRLPVKGIELRSLKDYFNYVFVVSRQKCRVDDISYMSPTRVKVIQRESSKDIIIYNLEKIDGKWKIVLEN